MKRIYVLMIKLLLLIACQNSTGKSACKYGTPTPVFRAEQPSIQSHRFTAQGNEATEEVTFSDGLKLRLLQSGCNAIRQEFQFVLPGNLQAQPADFWINTSIELLKKLGNLGLDYSAFNTWAQTIETQKEQLKLAESVALQPGFYVTIDRITRTENATLVLTLASQP
jgi:hypothetical protein